VPSQVPSLGVRESSVDDPNVDLTIGVSAIGGFLFLGMCDATTVTFNIDFNLYLLAVAIVFCVCFIARREKKKRVAVYVTTDDE
jgi:hypothetical protein